MTFNSIYCERKILGSPAIVWPLISTPDGWELWFAKTSYELRLQELFPLTITYFPTQESAIWQAEVTQLKNQIAIEFKLTLEELQLQSTLQFFIKQNNDDLIISITQSGFTSQSFWHGLKIKKERRRLVKFWEKALHKLEYQLETRLKGVSS